MSIKMFKSTFTGVAASLALSFNAMAAQDTIKVGVLHSFRAPWQSVKPP